VLTKNRERLLKAEVAHKFLAELLNHKEVPGLVSDEHFSVERYAGCGMGLDEELPRQGRFGRAAVGRPKRRT